MKDFKEYEDCLDETRIGDRLFTSSDCGWHFDTLFGDDLKLLCEGFADQRTHPILS